MTENNLPPQPPCGAPQQPLQPGGNPQASAPQQPTSAQPQAPAAEPQPAASQQPASAQPQAPVDAPQPPYSAYQQPYVAQQPAPQQPKKSRGWIVAIVVVIALVLVVIFGIASCTSAIASLGGISDSTDSAFAGSNSVAVIQIDSTITYDGTACSPEGFKELLDRAANDDNIVAVVLRVNSGGGSATAGEEMATYLREFREQTGKPVVVSSASINASAAYEISSQADYIYVAKTTEIGAIGTIMQSYDLSELMEKLGISVDSIASADSKDSSYGLRPLTEEERAYYQAMVDEINLAFIENVAYGRGMSVSQVKTFATGLPFTGTTAVKNGIADEVGTLEDAEAKAAQLAGARTYTEYSLRLYSDDFSDLIKMLSEQKLSVNELTDLLNESKTNGTIIH